VGFGISQLLPFIVQSLVSEGRIISIEQPEVHVHPRLQADLGDLLAAAIKEPRQHQFIIETHSEHLILRLQRLVYKGEIKPEDVSIIYVSRGPDGAKAERLHLDEEGDFIDEWPNGFFPERLRELR
jgi:predicted ATPase